MHPEKIDDADPQTVEDAIFRNAAPARPMIDRHRAHRCRRRATPAPAETGACGRNTGRSRNSARGNSLSPQPVSGVSSPRIRPGSDWRSREAQRFDQLSCRCWRWPAISSGASGGHGAGEPPQASDIGRIVLAVAVEGRDPGRLRRPDPAADRRALPAALPVAHQPQTRRVQAPAARSRRRSHRCCRHRHRRSRKRAQPVERGADLGDQRRDIFGLVPYRNDD